jgi:hypothetical protein
MKDSVFGWRRELYAPLGWGMILKDFATDHA